MKKFLVGLLAVIMLLAIPMIAPAKDVNLTFEWNQTVSSDFRGWRLYMATQSGGPYTQVGSEIAYTGSPSNSYTSSEVISAPDNAETTFYFVVNAWDNGDNSSGDSNEVSHRADFLPPGVPVNLKVTISTP